MTIIYYYNGCTSVMEFSNKKEDIFIAENIRSEIRSRTVFGFKDQESADRAFQLISSCWAWEDIENSLEQGFTCPFRFETGVKYILYNGELLPLDEAIKEAEKEVSFLKAWKEVTK